MKKPLHIIHEKIGAIETGLLRYRHNDAKISIPARIATISNELLHCTISEDLPSLRLLNKNITLVQKDKDNYMYVDGRISKIVKDKETILYIDVRKAFWFIRRRKGNVISLHEKYYYENNPVKLAS